MKESVRGKPRMSRRAYYPLGMLESISHPVILILSANVAFSGGASATYRARACWPHFRIVTIPSSTLYLNPVLMQIMRIRSITDALYA